MNMNLLKSVVSALVIGASSVVFAERNEVSANVNALQASQITLLKAKFDDVERRAIAWNTANKDLKEAKVISGGMSVAFDEAESLLSFGKWATALGLGGHGVTYYIGTTVEKYGRLMTISKLAWRIGIPTALVAGVGKGLAKYQIVLSEATYEQALANQALAKTLIQRDYEFILAQAPKLGAKVDNNVVSFEGLPEAVRNLFGGATWDLNVNRPN